jgi:tetratricopeptide (TPR) repeat protein/CHAT domain-containing protein
MRRVLVFVGIVMFTAPALADDAQQCTKAGYAAIKACTAVLQSDPSNAFAFLNRGIAYEKRGNTQAAIDDFTKAIELDPKNDRAYRHRANAHLAKQSLDLAIADSARAIEINPKDAAAYRGRGIAYSGKKLFDRAISDLSKSIALDPTAAHAYRARANAYFEANAFARVIADYSKAIEIDPRADDYNGRAWAYFKARRARKGLPDVEEALRLRPCSAASYDTRGHIFEALGRRTEAIADFRRALIEDPRIAESKQGLKRLGGKEAPPSRSSCARMLAALLEDAKWGGLYFGKNREAVGLAEQRVKQYRDWYGNDDAQGISVLAQLYLQIGRFSDAEAQYRQLLALGEAADPDHPYVSDALNGLAKMQLALGRYAEAERLYKRVLAIEENVADTDEATSAVTILNLGIVFLAQDRHSEAESIIKRSINMLEGFMRSTPTEAALQQGNLASALYQLGVLYRTLGRATDAEPLYQRSIALVERATHLGKGAAMYSRDLAMIYIEQGRLDEAEALLERRRLVHEQIVGPDHFMVGEAIGDLARLQQLRGHLSAAALLHDQSLNVLERALGTSHPLLAAALSNRAGLHIDQREYSEAKSLLERSLAIRRKALSDDHPEIAESLSALAEALSLENDWISAATYWRQSTGIATRRARRGLNDPGKALTGRSDAARKPEARAFAEFVKVLYKTSSQDMSVQVELMDEAFQSAQWALSSEAAGSLAQMALRSTKGDNALGLVVRERQDLISEWQKRDELRFAAAAQTFERRDAASEAANSQRLAAIDARISQIDERLLVEFPEYAALSRAEPLSIRDVQSELRPDEALVFFLETQLGKATPGETFVWLVTQKNARWWRSDLDTPALAVEVTALRCGLDAGLWNSDAASDCKNLVNAEPHRDKNDDIVALPFDVRRSHALYRALLGGGSNLLEGKKLLLVPSGALTQLPLQVLVTAEPKGGDYQSAAWLARSNALSVLPAVSSLRTLRRVGRPSSATKPMIGVGNPLLEGDAIRRPWEANLASLARQKQNCATLGVQQLAGASRKVSGAIRVRNLQGRADLSHLRSQPPLPETADELCAVAADLRVSSEDLLLGANATETSIKALDAQGLLASYRVVHFATHGAVAGEISATEEPGLILTPPPEQSEQDDGYLAASEVAALKLDAEWVILSACNTAAAGASGREALSGLARAFLYAGARALLVSHWAVDSDATVALISRSVVGSASDRTVGRAEALRAAMLTLIDGGELKYAHPSFWAPFVVVGEGGLAH